MLDVPSEKKEKEGINDDAFSIPLEIFPDYKVTHQPELSTNGFSDEIAKLAAKEVGARVYTLTGFKNDHVNFLVIGCHGSGNEAQKRVADAINNYIESHRQKPDFLLFVGDNLYDYGAYSPSDPAFTDLFDNMYYKEDSSAMQGIPSFALLGNHDHNLHRKAQLKYTRPPGVETAINEVAHTYKPDGTQVELTDIIDLQNLFRLEKLNINKLQKWNLPWFFYSLVAGDLQIFCLDSNTLVKDFIHFKKGSISDGENKINQFAWLLQEFRKAKDRKKLIVFAMHHPIFPHGKRILKQSYDTGIFLTSEQIEELKEICNVNSDSYYEFMALIFESSQLWPDIILTAHEHAMSYYNNLLKPGTQLTTEIEIKQCSQSSEKKPFVYPSKICQVGSGGGGGQLEKRKNFAANDYTGFFLSDNGFAKISCPLQNPQIIDIEFPMNYGQKFTHQSHLPVRQINTNPLIEIFRDIVIAASAKYFTHLHHTIISDTFKKQDSYPSSSGWGHYFSHTLSNLYTNFSSSLSSMKHLFTGKYPPENYDYVQELLAYFNQPELDENLETVINFFCTMTSKLANEEENSFSHFFKEALLQLDNEKHMEISSCINAAQRMLVLVSIIN